MTSLVLAATATLAAAGAEAEIHFVDGSTARGRLTSLADGRAAWTGEDDSGGEETAPLDRVLWIAFPERRIVSPPAPAVRVALRGGGLLIARQATVRDRTATVALHPERTVSIPLERIASLLTAEEAAVPQWRESAQAERQTDSLVAVRGEQRAQLDGVVGDLSEERLEFFLDSAPISVPRGRVVAVYYAGRAANASHVEVHDVHGNVWPADDVEWKGGSLHFTSAPTESLELTAEELVRVDFSRRRLAYLSDLTPAAVEHVPYFDVHYEVQRDQNYLGRTIRIGPEEFQKGLAVHSKTTLEYELDGGFRRFQATVGVEASAGRYGDMIARILGDGAPLWEARLRAGEPGAAVDVPLEGVRRLTITVDYGALADIGDHAAFGDARLVK